jgi:hypothetical protein
MMNFRKIPVAFIALSGRDENFTNFVSDDATRVKNARWQAIK